MTIFTYGFGLLSSTWISDSVLYMEWSFVRKHLIIIILVNIALGSGDNCDHSIDAERLSLGR